MDRPIVIIDPGHGGSDGGAAGGFQGLTVNEKEVVLKIALALKQRLEPDFTVYMTRSDDTFIPLHDRAVFANAKATGETRNAVFVSIHADSVAGHDNATGYTVHRKPRHHLAFARDVETRLKALWSSRGYVSDRSETIREHDFLVLRETATIPGVLVEAGFLDSEHDCSRLATAAHQEELADALRLAICDHFNILGEYALEGSLLSNLSGRGLTLIRVTAKDAYDTLITTSAKGGAFSLTLPRAGAWTLTFEDTRSGEHSRLGAYKSKSVTVTVTEPQTVMGETRLERERV